MEMLALPSGELSFHRAYNGIRNDSQGVKKTMTQEHKEKIAKAMADRKVRRKDNRLFLDLGDIRIVRVDDICLAVEMKRNKIWDLKGYYGSPKGAIEKVLNLTLDINQRTTIKELLEQFRVITERLLEVAAVQVNNFDRDTNAKHAKLRGGKK